MQITINLEPELIVKLDREAKLSATGRDRIIEMAVTEYIEQAKRKAFKAGFGLWKDRGIDALEYQENLRAEWDREP